MTAVRWHGRGDLRVERLAVPVPGDDQALVRVLVTGVCGSDAEEYRDGPVVTTGPVVLGHEIVGTVAAAAADGSGPPAGTTVVVDVVTGCGSCFWCVRHDEGRCPHLVVTGLQADGGLAEYVVGRASRLVPVPAGLDPEHAALAEPTAVAVRAARAAGDVRGRGVVVVGGGTVGLLVAQVLRHGGAEPVLVLEPDPWRASVAGRLGLDTAWAADADSRAGLARERFPPQGVDLVVECSGADGAPREAIRLARAGGRIVLLGVGPDDQAVDTTELVLKEKTVIGSAAHMWDDDVIPAVRLLAEGEVDVAPLITHRFPLAAGDAAVALLADRGEHTLKVLVRVPPVATPEEGRRP